MKLAFVILILVSSALSQTAREYYNELYKVGGLDWKAAAYACFPEEDNGAFFIFSRSEVLRQFLINEGQYTKLSKKEQADLDKGFIYVRSYFKGIAGVNGTYTKKGDTYEMDFDYKPDRHVILRQRYTFNWDTLRYQTTVTTIRDSQPQPSPAQVFGKCELVPTTVAQNGGR